MTASAFSVQRQPPVVPSVTVVVASPGVPIGGASGTVLTKSTATDYDTTWITRAALAADTAFTDKFGLQGAGAPGGTGIQGQWYWDTTNKREYLSDGVGWIVMEESEQAWNPAIAGITLGNGTKTGGYKRSDGWCRGWGSFVLGATSAVTASFIVTLPVAPSTAPGYTPFWLGEAVDLGVQEYPLIGINPTSTTVEYRAINTAGTYAASAAIAATVPLTFGTGDGIYFSYHYPMVTKYS